MVRRIPLWWVGMRMPGAPFMTTKSAWVGFRSAEGRREAFSFATELLSASISQHLQPIPLKHHEENLPTLTRNVAMYVPDLG